VNLKRIRTALRRWPLVERLELALRNRPPDPRPLRIRLPEAIEAALAAAPRAFLVQVGSNDGRHGDPLHELILRHPTWCGLFVGPVAYLFARLRATYPDPQRFLLENVAIGTQRGTRPFYYVSERASSEAGDALPPRHDQLGSFDRGHILRHLDGRLEPYVVEEQVRCLPLQDVLDRHAVEHIDLLHVDAEGFDDQVLVQLDLRRYEPQVILYEHLHLGRAAHRSTRRLLARAGYRLFEHGPDTLALQRRR